MSWPLVQIQDFCITGSGGTPSRKEQHYFEGDIPWIKSGDLRENIVTSATEYISELAIKNSSAKIISKGAILLAMYGATVGRMAILGIDAATNQAVCNIIPDENKGYPRYIYYALRSKVPEFLRNAVGGAQPNISQGMIKETQILLPPLSEQKRIAAILDKADAIRRKRQQAIELADEFLRSVFLDMFGDPVTNPNGWEVHPLQNIAFIQIGPFGTQLHKEDYIENGIPLINPTHIVDGKISPSNNLSISQEKHDELPEYHLKIGDVIMGRRGEMGRCAIVTEREESWMCGTGSLIIRPYKEGTISEYLQRFLSSQKIKSYLEKESLGATLPNLNKTIVGNIPVPIPSANTLQQFATIKQKNSFLKAKLKASQLQAEEQFKALSQRAFAGEL